MLGLLLSKVASTILGIPIVANMVKSSKKEVLLRYDPHEKNLAFN
jgi:hypothetical protein